MVPTGAIDVMTTPHEYPVRHLELMARLAGHLSAVPAQVLEHSYSYQSSGSWWSILLVEGTPFRIVLDGREGDVVVERSDTKEAPYEWSEWCRTRADVAVPDILEQHPVDIFRGVGDGG